MFEPCGVPFFLEVREPTLLRDFTQTTNFTVGTMTMDTTNPVWSAFGTSTFTGTFASTERQPFEIIDKTCIRFFKERVKSR